MVAANDWNWPVSVRCSWRQLAYPCTGLHAMGAVVVVSDFAMVADRLRSAGISDREISELVVAMFFDQSSVARYGTVGPRVAEWIGLMVTRAAAGSWQISPHVGGTLLADVICEFYAV